MSALGRNGLRRIGSGAAVIAVALSLAACRPPTPVAKAAAPAAPAAQAAAASCTAAPTDPTIRRLFDRVNSDRAANGVGPLCWNPQLMGLAQDHSNTMASTLNFAHRDLSVTINQPDYAGYTALAENILVGPQSMTADAIEDAFMNSPGHRANILATNVDSVGIALADSSDGRVWVTQNFGHKR
jgi:uncharacterized protein YkwD